MTEAATLKACCVDAYSSAAVRWLVGDSLHPGGVALTDRLARSLRLAPGWRVLDVACGPGTSAIAMAGAYDCEAVGVDLAPEALAEARERARQAGVSMRVTFVQGDAEELPLPDASVDAVLCECSLCLFPDRRRAAGELARVLRRGGRLALSDVTADPAALPPELRTLAARVACLGGAGPATAIAELLEDAGLAVETIEDHGDALMALLERVEGRLRMARLMEGHLPVELRGRVADALDVAAAARAAVEAGTLGYAAVYATRT